MTPLGFYGPKTLFWASTASGAQSISTSIDLGLEALNGMKYLAIFMEPYTVGADYVSANLTNSATSGGSYTLVAGSAFGAADLPKTSAYSALATPWAWILEIPFSSTARFIRPAADVGAAASICKWTYIAWGQKLLGNEPADAVIRGLVAGKLINLPVAA